MVLLTKRPESMGIEQYRLIRNQQNKDLKNYKKGTMFHESMKQEAVLTNTGGKEILTRTKTYVKTTS